MMIQPFNIGGVVGFNTDILSKDDVLLYMCLLHLAGYAFEYISIDRFAAIRVTGFNANCN